ncbi:MAG: ATP-binding cassette domain-containing protein [Syntrophotaleaceae bacterium]
MSETVIEAQNLRKNFSAFTAVDGISFAVSKGECFGLLGPNGAGKTSTVRMLYGYSPASDGTLRVFGLELRENRRTLQQRVGVCQQEDNLDPDLDVRENLLTFARYFNLPRPLAQKNAERLLQFFALGHKATANVRELSGGMKRRLMLARALINEPDLLILDEPTTGLDPQSRHQVWQCLEELKFGGLTLLLTTHYMEEASRLCDRLVIMDHGRILVEGPPGELIRRHVGRDIIEIAPPDDEIRQLLEQRRQPFEDLGRRLVIPIRNDGSDEGLFSLLMDAFPGRRCTIRPATLEDVFLHLTGRELRE